MPALPVSKVVQDPQFTLDLNVLLQDLIILVPAGYLHVRAAGEVSPESGAFNNQI